MVAGVENFRRSTTRKLLEKIKKNLGLGPNVRRRLTKNSGETTICKKVRLCLTGKRKTQFPENFGLHLDELSQFSAITTQTVNMPG